MKALVEEHLARLDVVALHQGTGVVEQQVLRHPAEVRERRLDPAQATALALVVEGHQEVTPRVPQRGNEQVDPDLLPGDPHPFLAKVDLHLPGRFGEAPRTVRLTVQVHRQDGAAPGRSCSGAPRRLGWAWQGSGLKKKLVERLKMVKGSRKCTKKRVETGSYDTSRGAQRSAFPVAKGQGWRGPTVNVAGVKGQGRDEEMSPRGGQGSIGRESKVSMRGRCWLTLRLPLRRGRCRLPPGSFL